MASLLTYIEDGNKAQAFSLIQNGANPNEKDSSGRSPLHEAAHKGFQDVVGALLDAGADPNVRDDENMTPLLLGARRGHANVVQALVQHGADMDVPNSDGLTALHFACHRGHKQVVSELLGYGARVKARDDFDDIPLHFAATEGHIEIMEMLMRKSPIDAQTNRGNTPLHLAALKGRTEAVKFLLKHNAKMLENTDGQTPLDVAQDKGHHDIVEILRQYEPKGKDRNVVIDSAPPQYFSEQPETQPISSGQAQPPRAKVDLSDISKFVVTPPPRGTIVECIVLREKSDKGVMYNLYYGDSQNNTFLLSSMKRKDSKTGNYPISLKKGTLQRSSEDYMGKLRANMVRTEYTVYDDGDNPSRVKRSTDMSKLRQELAAVLYSEKYPREMTVLVPSRDEQDNLHSWRPPHSSNGMLLEHFKRRSTQNMVELRNKQPTWNPEIRGYVLDFHNRVTDKSSKNFQLIMADDSSEDPPYVLLFGRNGKDLFALDFSYPFSAIQAFGVALTAFDTI